MYYVRHKDGTRWKVKSAQSLNYALNEIAHAKATGSIGGASLLHRDVGVFVLADVVQINSDNTERQPYTQPY